MRKTLAGEQVQKLFAYCTKNEIYEYDLQIEIVDHLASSIEDQWERNPELSFGWALKYSLSKFGKKGLQKLERKLKKQLRQNFNRILGNYFLEYFRWPKLVITIALFLFVFTAFRISPNNFWLLFSLSIPVSVFGIYYHYFMFPKRLDIRPAEGKTFLLIEYLKNINAKIGSFIQLPFLILMFANGTKLRYSNILWQEAAMSAFLALLIVFFYGHFFFLPQKIREYFFTNYLEHTS